MAGQARLGWMLQALESHAKVVALIQGNRDPQPTMSLRLVTPRNTGTSLEEEIASWRC